MDILVIRFSSLGDVVLATAVVEALGGRYPDARIHFLTKSLYTPLFDEDPRLERVIGIEGSEKPSQIRDMLGGGAGGTFDMVIDLHASLRSRAVCLLLDSPVKQRIDKHSLARRFMIWSQNIYRRRFDTLGSYLETLAPMGITGRVYPRLVSSELAIEETRTIVDGFDRDPVGIAPGAKHPTKRWNEESYARLADEINSAGFQSVFIGDRSDIPVIERIRGCMKTSSVTVAGKIGLATTVALIMRVRALITNDSGPMHIAGALGTPFAAIYGPTHPDLGFAPGYPSGTVLHSGIPCSPCSLHGKTPCRMKERYCMDDITWRMIFEKLNPVL